MPQSGHFLANWDTFSAPEGPKCSGGGSGTRRCPPNPAPYPCSTQYSSAELSKWALDPLLQPISCGGWPSFSLGPACARGGALRARLFARSDSVGAPRGSLLDLCKHRSEFWLSKLNHCLAVNLALPKRRPDLQPLDYSFYNAINSKLREEEKSWPSSKKETRKMFGKWVVAAYFSLPEELIRRSCEGMKKRLSMVLEAKSGHFKRD